jgi:hypothetical protein
VAFIKADVRRRVRIMNSLNDMRGPDGRTRNGVGADDTKRAVHKRRATSETGSVDEVEQVSFLKWLLKHPINSKLGGPCNDRREG